MSSDYRKTRRFYELITAVVVVTTLISKFITAVTEKGRLLELAISTPLLITAYYLIHLIKDVPFPVYLIPITVYFIYWSVLFGSPKKLHISKNNHWADEDWWWNLDGWQFEEEVAKVFIKLGFNAKVTKKTGDDGADIIMYKNKTKYIVQCKHYIKQASPESVRALWGIKDEFNADEVIMVASSGVSQRSLKYINSRKPYYTLYTLQDIMKMATM